MTTTPHDALFKAAFEQPEHAGALFRAILPRSVVEAIEWESMARDAGTFIDPELADRHSDLLFSVRLRGKAAFLYLVLEHQSSPDHDMPLRMLVYLVRIWERFRKEHGSEPLPPIVPLLVSHVPGGWSSPRTLEDLIEPHPATVEGLAELMPRFSLTIEHLAQLTNDEIRAHALAVFPTLALWLLRDARDPARLVNDLRHWGDAFAQAFRAPHGVAALVQLLRYVSLVTGDLHFETFRAKIREQAPEAERAAMTTFYEKVLAEGAEKGRAEGRVELLRKQLVLKFGEIRPEHDARIAAATIAELDRWAERVLTAASLDDVLAG